MKRGLVAATSAAILLGASMIWKQFVAPRPETTVAHAAFDKFGRLAAYPGKEKAACPQQSARTAVVFAIGQSNIGNFGAARLSTAYGARVVNFFDGACWIAGSPLYGADQTLGEALTPLGDRLIETGAADNVVLAVAAIGGRPISHFANGPLRPMLDDAIASLGARYAPSAIIWHQGESDLGLSTSPKDYRRDFDTIVARLQKQWPSAPVFISIATKCLPILRDWRADNSIAMAQRQLVDPARGVFAGVDTDALFVDADRSDECHMARSGQEKFASAYAALIARMMAAKGQSSVEPFNASASPAR
ncbi:MAG TPA: sialate O-acetylesterase [Rhodoblastus sp.]|nr:sialate O-acetylesterase [Rhodoblastus sp.]